MAAGALLLAKSILDLVVGDPPSTPAETQAWLTSHELSLTLTNEILAFAAVLLIPTVLALYRSLDGFNRPSIAFGCGLLAVSVPVILVLAVVHGRLVYPVYDIDLTDSTTVALVVSLYYGGAHMVTLLSGAALVVLGLGMRRGPFGRAVAVFGVTAGALQIPGSFPWLIGPLPASMIQAMSAAWLGWVGWRLTRRRAN